jgi:hypothetical protein
MELPSKFQIGDEVAYENIFEGTGEITAVRFTKSAVWYDILDAYTGVIASNVDSNQVSKINKSLNN